LLVHVEHHVGGLRLPSAEYQSLLFMLSPHRVLRPPYGFSGVAQCVFAPLDEYIGSTGLLPHVSSGVVASSSTFWSAPGASCTV